MSETHDLSGQWSGIYNYPALYPPNTFEATIRDSAGVITGETVEPDAHLRGPDRHAVIDGSHAGNSVRFTKIYDDFELDAPVIHYQGTIQADGDEIEGRWDIPGVWSGTFLMVRGSRTEATVERKVTEKIDL